MEDGVSLAIGGGAVGALATIVGSWIKARYASPHRAVEGQRHPDALDVTLREEFADRKANDADHQALFLRMSAVEQKTAHADGVLEQLDGKIDTINSNVTQILMNFANGKKQQ